MNEVENKEDTEVEGSRKGKEKRVKKTQGQIIQEALGLNPTEIQDVEKKLFIVRFLDFFSEDTLEFVFKERIVDQNLTRLNSYMDSLQIEREEEKLLKQSYDSKDIHGVIKNVKSNAEALAISKGIKSSVNKRLRRLTLYITLPLFALLTVLTFMPLNLYVIIFPILCFVCLMPQFIRRKVVSNWVQFKEQNKNDVYTGNREEIMILKSFAGEILNNIRTRLLEIEVPLQLIKFTLFSRDYENLNLVSERNVRGFMQYFFTFEYPSGMQPFSIPDNLQQYQQPIIPGRRVEKAEKNFIVLSEMQGKDGVITYFVPTLKDMLANEINQILNECEFSKAPKDFNNIIPNYSETMAIYCVCGEIAKIANVQVCNWKNRFTFYLFEGEECKCGETIYALSLMEESTDIPDELKEIFLS